MAAPMESMVSEPVKMKSSKMKKRSVNQTEIMNEVLSANSSSPPCKKQNMSFTEIDLKLMLRDPNTVFQGLEEFVSSAKAYPAEVDYDIVAGYCRTSAECQEILQLLDSTTPRKHSEIFLIFQSLECILLRIADDLGKFKQSALSVVKRFLAAHMSIVYSSLHFKGKATHVKTTLKLLIAMVMQSVSSARDVILQFDFYHAHYTGALSRRDRKDPQDVRTCVLHFLMSFLIIGDDNLIKQLVDSKGVLNAIFPGMGEDRSATIELVLSTLLNKIVQNPTLSKTSKIRLFNDWSLKEIGRLYLWTGKAKTANEETQEETEEQKAVHDVTHQFLIEVCSSHSSGINFFDKTFATSGKNQNHIVGNFLGSLPPPHLSGKNVADLVCTTLQACPDLLMWYLPTLRHSVDPRPSDKWKKCLAFIEQIYRTQPAVSPALSVVTEVPAHKHASMALNTLIPPKETWAQIISALKKPHAALRHWSLHLIAALLDRSTCSLQYCHNSDTSQLQKVAAPLTQAICKILPPLPVILNCWMQASKKESQEEGEKNEGEKEEKKEGEKGEKNEGEKSTTPNQDLAVPPQVDQMALILRVLCVYQSLLPMQLTQSSLDFGSLMDAVREAVQQVEEPEDTAMVQLYLLKLLAESDTRQLTWTQHGGGTGSILYLLLDMVVTTRNNPTLASATTYLVSKLLCNTGVFDGAEEEVAVWLRGLCSISAASRASVLMFVEQYLSRVIRDPHKYTEQIAELIVEAGSSGFDDVASVATSQAVIDAVLSVDAVCLEDDDMTPDSKEITASASSYRTPFSCLLMVALERAAEDKSKGVADLLEAVVSQVFLYQVDPAPLVLLIHQRAAPAGIPSLLQVARPWMSRQLCKKNADMIEMARVTSDDVLAMPPTTLLCNLLHAVYTSDLLLVPAVDKLLKRRLDQVSIEKTAATVCQLLLYISTEVQRVHKDWDASCNKIDKLFDFLNHLFGRIADSCSMQKTLDTPQIEHPMDTDENENTDSNMDLATFSSLSAPTVPVTDTLVAILTIFTEHTVVKNHFLAVQGSIGSGLSPLKKKRKSSSISHFLSVHIAKVLELIPQDCLYHSDVLDWYTGQVQAAIGSFEKDTVAMESSLWLVEVFDVLIPMATSDVCVELCRLLVHQPVSVLLDDDAQLSRMGALLLTVVDKVWGQGHKEISCHEELTMSTVHTMCELCQSSESLLPSQTLQKFLHTGGSWSVAVDAQMVEGLLECRQLVQVVGVLQELVRCSAACWGWVNAWYTQHQSKLGKIKARGKYAEVAWALLQHFKEDSSKDLLQAIHINYWDKACKWLLSAKSDSKDESNTTCTKNINFKLLMLMCKITASNGQQGALWRQLVEGAIATEAQHLTVLQLHVLHWLTHQLKSSKGHGAVGREMLVFEMQALIWVMRRKEKADEDLKQELLKQLQYWSHQETENLSSEIPAEVWSSFIRYGLRYCYKNSDLMLTLCHLLPLMYAAPSVESDLQTSVHDIHQMVLSHSQFMATLVPEDPKSPSKAALVRLMLQLVEMDATCCDSEHLPIIFGACGASLAQTDQSLLKLLTVYESSGCDFTTHKPYMWGAAALEQYSLRRTLEASLLKQPSLEQLLDLLEPAKLFHSSLNFPLLQEFSATQDRQTEDSRMFIYDSEIYDPAFLLPVFSYLVAPECMVDCRVLVERECVGYWLCALSSHSSAVRGAAYHILNRYTFHLDAARFPEKKQVQSVLECVRQSVETANAKLPCLITIFLARALLLVLKPGDVMYGTINNFLLLKPTMDITNVPELYKLFHSADTENFRVQRQWLLQLIRDGLRETQDFHVCERRFTMKLLQTSFMTPLSDPTTSLLVLQVIERVCSLRSAALRLLKHHAIASWLQAAADTSMESATLIGQLLKVASALWTALLGTRDELTTPQDGMPPCLPVVITNCILSLQLHLLHHYRSLEDSAVLLQSLQTLQSVLSHAAKTNKHHGHSQGQGVMTTRIHATDVCRLLSYWALVSQEETLFQDIGAVTDGAVEQIAPAKNKKSRSLVLAGDIKVKCLEVVLAVVQMWRPDQFLSARSITHSELSLYACVCQWTFTQIFKEFSGQKEILGRQAGWVRGWVRQETGLQHLLLSGTSVGQELTWDLLHTYDLLIAACDMAEDRKVGGATGPLQEPSSEVESQKPETDCETPLSAENNPELDPTIRGPSDLNDTFLTLMDCALAGASSSLEKLCVVRKTLKKSAFKKALLEAITMAAESRGGAMREKVMLLVWEVWRGAGKPGHFCAV